MLVGERLKELREERHLSQGDIEKRSGLLRCYISRVENGHTVPAVETLEKIARALDVPMYRLFYTGEELPQAPPQHSDGKRLWGDSGKSRRYLAKLVLALQKMTPNNRELILLMASKARQRNRKKIR
jgi:transcriptional regulator with XRE-family HTH domain